jgi:flagellin-like protein
MRGISAIIAVVLILLITISLAAGAYLFLSMTMSQTTTAAQQGISQTMTQMTKSFTIEAVSGGKIWVRNTGQVPISNLTIYIDGAPANTSNVVIQPGEVGVIQIYDAVDFSRPREIEIPGGTTTESKVVAGESLRDPSLVGYWKFDEGSGNIAYDSSGNGYNGILVNGPTWTSGKYGGALKFNGVNNFVTMGNVLNMGANQPFTISVWVNAGNSTYNSWGYGIVSKGGFNWQKGYSLCVRGHLDTWSQNKAGFDVVGGDTGKNGTELFGTTNLVDTGWHFITAIRDSDTDMIKVYVDGILEKTVTNQTFADCDLSNTYNFTIGNLITGPNQYFNGTIDEVRIYNRALSADEIWNQYIHGPI